MTYLKPCRICNHIPLVTPLSLPALSANLREAGDRYELRIRVPDSGERNYVVFIKAGTLYVYDENGNTNHDCVVLASFTLPANVLQAKVIALQRPYGLKILMPVTTQEEATILVPLVRYNKD